MKQMTTTWTRLDHRQRRVRTRRADLIWSIVMLLVLQVGFALAMRTGVVKLEDSTNFACKLNRFEAQLASSADDAFVALAFGSSRVMNGVDAGYLTDHLSSRAGRPAVAYNFGVMGSGNIYTYLSLEKIVNEGICPDLVFVEVYPRFLVQDSETKWFTANELRSKNFENTARYGIQPVNRPWYREWLASWHTYRFNILNCISPKMLPMKLRENWAVAADEFGWVAVDRALNHQHLEKQIDEFAKISGRYHLGGHSCQALKDTLALCRDKGIQCVLVWMPEPSGIRKNYRPEIVPAVESFLADLKQEFDFQTVMSRDWVPDAGFYDSTHMNRKGADEFTEKLAAWITGPFDKSIARLSDSHWTAR